jgi:parallel beta-helix repeat protein
MEHAAVLAAWLGVVVAEGSAAEPVRPVDGMQITAHTTLAPGTYVLHRGIEIVADDVTLDGGGAVLIGQDHHGSAITAAGRRGVTVRNVCIERFYHGMVFRDCDRLTVRDCRVRDTHEVGGGPVWLDIWLPVEKAYGAGILLHHVHDSRIEDNDVQHQQNGLLMYGCRRCVVAGNDASFNSGWGIHLYESSDNVIRGNVADWCTRIYRYPQGGYYPGADAAGILLVVNSCRNLIEKNMFRGGGDGVFLAGYRHPDIVAPCNDNVFRENDCSLSPNNAFEATFSRGNRFENNVAGKSNYGFWLGYSAGTVVSGNKILDNRIAGVAIEHGRRNEITGNEIKRNRTGIELWTDEDKQFVEAMPETAYSAETRVKENEIVDNGVGVALRADAAVSADLCRDHRVLGNRVAGNRTGVRISRARGVVLRGNVFVGNVSDDLELDDAGNIDTSANEFTPRPSASAPSGQASPRE